MPDFPSSGPLAPVASYRALFAVPSLARALIGMQVARVGNAMIGVASVLFVLSHYRSVPLAGIVTFAMIFPGLATSPIAGALLDRHGRIRLIVLDFAVATVALGLIGALALADALPVWLLLLIAAVSSLTSTLSATGLRTLFPMMVPNHLWARLNAVDSNGWVVASIIGPPIAAVLVSLIGGPATIVLIGLTFGVAALIIHGVPEPPLLAEVAASGRILVDAWQGLLYAVRNPTLRALAISISTLNIGGGMVTLVIPLIVLQRLGLGEAAVGYVFAVQGLAGIATGLLAGRLHIQGRERRLIIIPMFLWVPLTALLWGAWSLPVLLVAMALMGLLNGPMDVAMFTLRQRRTDPAWMGRAFAISMSLNFSGYPIGSAIGGAVAGWSIDAAIGVGVVTALAAALFAAVALPPDDRPGALSAAA